MSLIVTLSGSPAPNSRTLLLARYTASRLTLDGFEVESIDVRDVPPEDLLHARAEAPGILPALERIARADGLVVTTPVYKASYTGLLKAFLDLLPQSGLAGKVALPLATGGTLAHLLAVDYALRPLLATLGASHVVSGLFLLDKLLERRTDGTLEIEPDLRARLDALVDTFAQSVRRAQ